MEVKSAKTVSSHLKKWVPKEVHFKCLVKAGKSGKKILDIYSFELEGHEYEIFVETNYLSDTFDFSDVVLGNKKGVCIDIGRIDHVAGTTNDKNDIKNPFIFFRLIKILYEAYMLKYDVLYMRNDVKNDSLKRDSIYDRITKRLCMDKRYCYKKKSNNEYSERIFFKVT